MQCHCANKQERPTKGQLTLGGDGGGRLSGRGAGVASVHRSGLRSRAAQQGAPGADAVRGTARRVSAWPVSAPRRIKAGARQGTIALLRSCACAGPWRISDSTHQFVFCRIGRNQAMYCITRAIH
ncbi:Protein SET DOMAIN GROUP 41 [Zea mays]|uniref:Protein SET DOMAIN GROUP 41 n=1 Tax=Zea mays TaxID=4577 RepID=A0A1D6EB15_MAIZE|nr:Protein SET DOMAIN GROUP 41 [Zea mays]